MTRVLEPMRGRSLRGIRRPGERGAALVVAILVLTILTVIGIALMLITSTESRIAANEWSVNRAFYSADAGLRWASAAMESPSDFMRRPEFCGPQPKLAPCPDLAHAFGEVLFPLPSFRHGTTGALTGWLTKGRMKRPMRFQFAFRENGTTGWNFITDIKSWLTPTPSTRLNSSGRLTRSATGFVSCLARSSASEVAEPAGFSVWARAVARTSAVIAIPRLIRAARLIVRFPNNVADFSTSCEGPW